LRGDGNQSKIIKLKNFGGRPVATQSLFQRLHDFLPVAALVHVDEIDDDDATQIAQPYLAHDFLDRINVGFDDRVFETRCLANILAGIHIDRNQRFRLVNDNVAATL